MLHDQFENLLRRQALVSVDRDGHVADGERVADVGVFTGDAGGQLYGVLIRLNRNTQPVMVAADEEVGLHVGSLYFEKCSPVPTPSHTPTMTLRTIKKISIIRLRVMEPPREWLECAGSQRRPRALCSRRADRARGL